MLHNLKGLNFHMLNIYKHDDKNIRYIRVCITHKIWSFRISVQESTFIFFLFNNVFNVSKKVSF